MGYSAVKHVAAGVVLAVAIGASAGLAMRYAYASRARSLYMWELSVGRKDSD